MSSDQYVWYAAFGSNLSAERFTVYLTGGLVPNSTSGRVQDGARNPALPTADEAFVVERSLLFSGANTNWGGGATAVLDGDHNPVTPTMARAYRITLQQFEDVFAQENRIDTPPQVDLAALMAGPADLASRKYGRIELVGEIGAEPVVTLTAPRRPTELAPADLSYLQVMAAGLRQAWSLSARETADYLAGRPGNAGFFDPGELATTFT